MHMYYILVILFLVGFLITTTHKSVVQKIKLKKEINSLITSKTNLLLMIEGFHTESETQQSKINDLTKTLADALDQVSELKITTVNLYSEIKEINLKHKNDLNEAVQAARKDALKRSRSVLRGQATEHLAPFILKDTNPKDYRFMGNPIDYVCFEGLSNVLDKTSEEIISITFIDIKTGKSTLNKSQRKIRDAINEGRVKFSVINLDKKIQEQNDQIKEEYKVINFEES